ncbi:hypothetical protein [Peribacillus asahii]|uniref:hypothetical protein n=1 Tax=Peribacillus asahii TaxID=228899 RepID=UPI0020796C8C|nr:hypothetical protein [Peribacillus asahii]USK61342.1 hypothetical protein LIT37_08505 [Peribacillus asahii]
MTENLRDMTVSIGFDIPRSPLSGLNREMNQFTRNTTTASSAMGSFASANRGMIRESQALNRAVNRQTEFIRRLSSTSGMTATQLADDWAHMSAEMRRSFIQNHNQLIEHQRDLLGVEENMRRLGNQMGHYTGTTGDFMSEIRRLGREHRRISDEMINSDMTLRQGFIQTLATMSAMSTQSNKISANYERMGRAIYNVNRPFLAVTNNLERIARSGNAAQLALEMLGPNASMKALQDQITLINQGIMRQQSVLMVAGVAWLGFTAILANAAFGPDPAEVRAEQDQLTRIYKEEWRKRVDEISHFVGIFEKVSVPKVKPSDVMKAMQSQLKAMETWRSSLQSLAKKGVDEGLIKELQKAGPAAAYEIRAIDRMSKPELDKYVQTWQKKMKLARTQATDELTKLKQQTDSKIKELQDSIKPLGAAWEKFKGTWATVLKPFVDLWGQLAAGFVTIGTKIGEFVNYLNSISPWITKLAGMFLYLAVTFTVLLSPLAIGIGYFMGLRAAFTAAWVVIAPLVTGLGAMMGTVLLVSGVVLGLGVALYLLWNRSETFRNGVINGWNSIKSAAISVFNFLKPYIMQAIGAVTTFVGQKLTQIKDFWNENGAMILQATKNFFTPIVFIVRTVLGAVWSVMKFVWPAVLLLVKSVWSNIRGVIDGALKIIMGLAKIFGGLFTGNFSKMWEGVKQVFFGAIQFVWNLINLMMFAKILSAGKMFITGFRDVFVGLWTGLRTLFTKSVTNVKNTVQYGFTAMKLLGQTIMTGFKNSINGIWTAIHGNIRGMLGKIGTSIKTAWTTARTETKTLFGMIKDDVTGVFKNIVQAAKDLPGKIGRGISSMAGRVEEGIGTFAGKVFSGFKKVINGAIDGINWAMKGIGLNDMTITPWNPPKYAKGTNFHPGGPAILGDGGGPELYRTPSGHVGLSPGRDTLMNLPRGTEVLPHRQSMTLLNAGLPAYKSGVEGKGKEGSLLHDAVHKAKNIVGNVKEAAFDVWSYISNPTKLASKIFKEFGVTFPKMSGAIHEFGKGSVSFLKDKTVGFLKEQLAGLSFVGSESKDPGAVGPGSGYGGMMKYVEAVYNSVKSRFGKTHFMGGYNDRNVVGGSSKSMHAYGRAFDIGGSHETMSKIAEYLRTTASNLQYVIYNRRIAGPGVGKSWRKYTGLNPHTDHVHADFKAVRNSIPGEVGKFTGSASAWRDDIIRAAAQMKELVTPSEINGIIAQIQRESTGNQRIVQSPLVRDVNTRNGNPAKGLLQYIPQTFAKYRMKGYGDIFNGYHQLLAFFNNTNWRKDLPYGRRGWGPTGLRKYATGGIAWKPQIASLAENGWKEFIIPTQPSMRKNAHALLQQANQELGYTPESSGSSYRSSSGGSRPVINFNPTINIDMSGNSNNSVDVERAIRKALDEQWQRLISIYGIEVVR